MGCLEGHCGEQVVVYFDPFARRNTQQQVFSYFLVHFPFLILFNYWHDLSKGRLTAGGHVFTFSNFVNTSVVWPLTFGMIHRRFSCRSRVDLS